VVSTVMAFVLAAVVSTIMAFVLAAVVSTMMALFGSRGFYKVETSACVVFGGCLKKRGWVLILETP